MIEFSQEQFERLKKNDPELRIQFYLAYKQIVYNYLIAKVCGNRDVAADLFGEVNTNVLDSLNKLRNRKNLLGWVLSIAHNVYCDYVSVSVKKDKLIKKIQDDLVNNPQEKADGMEKEKKERLVGAAIRNLDDKYSRIITMKYYEHKSIKELARIFDTTETAIGGMLYRAKEALKKEVSKLERYF